MPKRGKRAYRSRPTRRVLSSVHVFPEARDPCANVADQVSIGGAREGHRGISRLDPPR